MADAKSRYEIVQELIDKKQGFLDQLSQLSAGLVRNEAQISKMLRDQEREKKVLQESQAQALEDLKANVETEKKNISERQAMLERKVSAVDEAITALKALSAQSTESK